MIGAPRLCLCFVLLMLPACSSSNASHPSIEPSARAMRWQSPLDVGHPLVGVIWDVAAQRRVAGPELFALAQSSSIVLVGEAHDNPDHHRLQARLLEAFAARHDSPAVVFEMLDREQQPTVDASLSAHPNDVDILAKALDWSSSGWPPWSIYRTVFEAAVAAHARLLAGGLDRAAAMRIAHEGIAAFDPSLDTEFGLHIPLPPDVQDASRAEMRDAHCGLLPEAMLDSMVVVQRARDALLAQRLHEGSVNGHGALLVAGVGHARRDWGVPAQLARAYGLKSLAIGLLEVRAKVTTPGGYAEDFRVHELPFDFVWFTPRTHDVDHCAELREHTKANGE